MLALPKRGPRMESIVRLTPRCAIGAEIGADHGIISAHLLCEPVCDRMVVTDVSAASLKKAKRLFAAHGLCGQACFAVADGLDALDDPVDAIIIAGMGAGTMEEMLKRGRNRLHNATLVLQPRPDPHRIRRWLHVAGYRIVEEDLVQERGRYYITMRAERGTAQYTPKQLFLGPHLLQVRPGTFAPYLAWLKGCLLAVRGDGVREQIEWVEQEEQIDGLYGEHDL